VTPDGAIRCFPTREDQRDCQLDCGGTHRIVVRDLERSKTGSYRITIALLTSATDAFQLQPEDALAALVNLPVGQHAG
jgi:hypothetical protein